MTRRCKERRQGRSSVDMALRNERPARTRDDRARSVPVGSGRAKGSVWAVTID
ncbi:hypothetical protein [Demetria terragena]|uniref:hypothetical protein n=1 Tax=Demetria terragena TaxID=63959 RepID=UPI001FDF73CF|nr:hypothetical protein [Demetria terragena]